MRAQPTVSIQRFGSAVVLFCVIEPGVERSRRFKDWLLEPRGFDYRAPSISLARMNASTKVRPGPPSLCSDIGQREGPSSLAIDIGEAVLRCKPSGHQHGSGVPYDDRVSRKRRDGTSDKLGRFRIGEVEPR